MTVTDFYKMAQRRGAYHFLIAVEIIDPISPETMSRYFTNSLRDLDFDGHTYEAIPIEYKPANYTGTDVSGGSLEFAIMDDNFMRYLDMVSNAVEIIVHILYAVPSDSTEEEIHEIGKLRHKYGTINSSGETITWNLKSNDRVQMQLNPWIMDSELLWGQNV